MQQQITVRADSLVLIVDHYRVGQRIALLQLNQFGLSAHVVTTCRQAIRQINKHSYSLILIGWGQPLCSSSACIRFARKLEKTRKDATTIVGVASHFHPGDKERCIASGMDDLLCKPISTCDMQQLLRRHRQIA